MAVFGAGEQARAGIENLCRHTASLLFSCAGDTEASTDCRVRPLFDWLQGFREFGFAPDFAANFHSLPGAILLRRCHTLPEDELLHYFARSRLLASVQLAEEGFVERDTYELLAAVAAKDRWIHGQRLRMRELEKQVERQAQQIAIQQRELEQLKLKLLERDAALDTVLSSKGWQLLNRYRGWRDRLFSRFLPAAARGRKLATTISADEYQGWIAAVEEPESNPERIAAQLAGFRDRPLISILLPVVQSSEKALERAILSVRQQVYPAWELCLCSRDGAAESLPADLHSGLLQDTRIRTAVAEGPGLSAVLNGALGMARGQFAGILEPDGELSPDALFRVVEWLQHSPEADFIYSDEDRLDPVGGRRDPFFKPNWSPEYMLSVPYTGHFSVYRRTVLQEAGGFRSGMEGAEAYDLALRVSERSRNIVHIPRVLYHGSRLPTELPPSPAERRDSSSDAGRQALQEHMQRCGIEAQVLSDEPGRYRVRPRLQGKPLVSIVIATKDRVPLLRRCLSSIEAKTEYPNYEIVIADNDSVEPATAQFLASLPHRIVPAPGPFNFSRINNLAAEETQGQYLLFLNNDTEVLSPEWLHALLELGQLPQMGVVGAKLLYPNNTIQHAGVLVGMGGVAGHCYRWFPAGHRGYFDSIARIRNYSAVTAACCLIPRSVFKEVGGFDEDLPTAFDDVDLCLRILRAGYRVVYTPYAVLYHHESKSRGYELDPRDVAAMKRRWGEALTSDPAYNPNLSLGSAAYTLAK
jgi:GT2 family glycosyltransferase